MSNLERTVPNLLTAPLDVPNPSQALGRSLWLYLALAKHVNGTGLVIRRREELANDLSVAESVIDEWLSRLVRVELVQVLSPAPFLTVRLLFWSSSEAKSENIEAFAGQSDSNSYSSRNSSSAKASINNASYAEEGGLGEGEDLRRCLQDVLPEAEPQEIDLILDRYPRAAIRRTLDRVAKTPASKIRKSKTALFRFLLGKYSGDAGVSER